MQQITAIYIGGPFTSNVTACSAKTTEIIVSQSIKAVQERLKERTESAWPIVEFRQGEYKRTPHLTKKDEVIFQWMGWANGEI